MSIKIDWGAILQPLITALLTAIINAITKAVEKGEWSKAMNSIAEVEAVSLDNPLAGVGQLAKIAEELNA